MTSAGENGEGEEAALRGFRLLRSSYRPPYWYNLIGTISLVHFYHFLIQFQNLRVVEHIEKISQIDGHADAADDRDDSQHQPCDGKACERSLLLGEDHQHDGHNRERKLDKGDAAGDKGQDSENHGGQGLTVALRRLSVGLVVWPLGPVVLPLPAKLAV